MKVRGTLTLAFVAISLILADLVQRTFISLSVRLLPSRRHRILSAWQQFLAWLMLSAVRFPGGARIDSIPVIPGGPGILVLMNHQSLLDIPLVVRAIRPGYPRIVTRERYANGKPLISHMVRLYQYPTVNPRATVKSDLARLSESAAEVEVPLVIYPEGTRTRDGELGRFKRNGLRAILGARSWQVWYVIVDGYWECAKLKDFRANVSTIRGRMRVDGPVTSPDPGEGADAVEAFIDQAHRTMERYLAELRGTVPS